MDRFLTTRIEGFEALIDPAAYPISAAEFVEQHGTRRIEHPDGESERLGDVIERVSPDVYETPEEVVNAILTGVGMSAIGRARYSDRDPPAPGTDETVKERYSL